jgi:hypothetical protein
VLVPAALPKGGWQAFSPEGLCEPLQRAQRPSQHLAQDRQGKPQGGGGADVASPCPLPRLRRPSSSVYVPPRHVLGVPSSSCGKGSPGDRLAMAAACGLWDVGNRCVIEHMSGRTWACSWCINVVFFLQSSFFSSEGQAGARGCMSLPCLSCRHAQGKTASRPRNRSRQSMPKYCQSAGTTIGCIICGEKGLRKEARVVSRVACHAATHSCLSATGRPTASS